jgi:hypothetical protein
MKNYIVIATREFDDYEGLECKPENHKEHRKKGDVFNCTKERYEYLKSNNAVLLRGIEKAEEQEEKEIVKIVKKRTTKKK